MWYSLLLFRTPHLETHIRLQNGRTKSWKYFLLVLSSEHRPDRKKCHVLSCAWAPNSLKQSSIGVDPKAIWVDQDRNLVYKNALFSLDILQSKALDLKLRTRNQSSKPKQISSQIPQTLKYHSKMRFAIIVLSLVAVAFAVPIAEPIAEPEPVPEPVPAPVAVADALEPRYCGCAGCMPC